jgi:hypothetical protein
MFFLLNKILSGHQLCQVVRRNKRFRNHLCPHHRGTVITGYLKRRLYIHSHQIPDYGDRDGFWNVSKETFWEPSLSPSSGIWCDWIPWMFPICPVAPHPWLWGQTAPKTLVSFDHLTWLMAWEDSIEFSRYESLRSYICFAVFFVVTIKEV